jgi:cell division protease FtsH
VDHSFGLSLRYSQLRFLDRFHLRGDRYTQIETSQALDAISKAQVQSAELVDKDQKIRLILNPGSTIKGSSKVEAFYVARQEPTIVDALTGNPPPKGWNVKVPSQSILVSFLFLNRSIPTYRFLVLLDDEPSARWK